MSDTSDTDKNDTHGGEDLAALRAELAELRAGKAAAERTANTERQARRSAEMANMSAQERALVADQEACDSRIESIEGDLQAYEDDIARLADEPGHGKEIAALNRKMSAAAAKLETENGRKTFLTGQREKFNKQTKEAVPPDTNDKILANGSRMSQYGPRTQAWLESHPKAFTDARYFGKCVAAAIKATQAEGIEDQSDEYFRFIEAEIGDTQNAPADPEGEEVATDPPAPRRANSTEERYDPESPQPRAAGRGSMASAAPPTRQTPQGGGNNPRRAAALTPQEREVADGLYASIRNPADRYVKYAENKKIMMGRETGHFQQRAN